MIPIAMTALALVPEARAWTSPLLNQVPEGYQYLLTDPTTLDVLCNHADRLFIGRMVNVSSFYATAQQKADGYPSPLSRVKFDVLAQVTSLGHQASTLTIHYPGG